MKRRSTTAIANERLQEIVDWCDAHPGIKVELIKRYAERTTSCALRPLIEKWLRRSVDKRAEPRLGAGLLLIEVFEELKRECPTT